MESRRAFIKARGLCQDLGPGSIGYWAYFLRAFLQARAFEPALVFLAKNSASDFKSGDNLKKINQWDRLEMSRDHFEPFW